MSGMPMELIVHNFRILAWPNPIPVIPLLATVTPWS